MSIYKTGPSQGKIIEFGLESDLSNNLILRLLHNTPDPSSEFRIFSAEALRAEQRTRRGLAEKWQDKAVCLTARSDGLQREFFSWEKGNL